MYFSHRMSPFYQEDTTFETTLEYYGGENVNITRVETTTNGVSDITFKSFDGGPGTNFVKLGLKMDNVLVTQSIMKVFGFNNPKNWLKSEAFSSKNWTEILWFLNSNELKCWSSLLRFNFSLIIENLIIVRVFKLKQAQVTPRSQNTSKNRWKNYTFLYHSMSLLHLSYFCKVMC